MVDGPWLVVGATGLVGSNCLRALRARGIRAIGASRSTGSEGATLDVIDAGQVGRVLAEFEPRVVIDAAGATAVDRCEAEPGWARAVNTDAVSTLVGSLAAEIVLVYLSSDYVFDGREGPYDEKAIPAPINVYGQTKLAGEDRAADHPEHLIVRTTVVYGREAADTGKNSLYQLASALRGGDPFRASTDEIGTPTYARDLADVLIDLVLAEARGTFHVGGADLVSRYDYACAAAELLGFDSALVKPVLSSDTERPAARPLRHGLVSARAEGVIGRRTMSVREGVASARRELGW